MIEVGVDHELERLFAKYKRLGAFMPLVAMDYNNSLAFNTRSLAKNNLLLKTVRRSGSSRWMTGGRVLSVRKARFSRDVERIRAEVGGRVVPGARDPHFMARLEFGGQIPRDSDGRTAIPTVKGARRGSIAGNIGRPTTVPSLSAKAVTARNVAGSPRKKRAIAMAVAIRERKKIVKMRDKRGRPSIYRVKGQGRGKKRRISEVTKIWTLSDRQHSTKGIQWLSDAMHQATGQRVKVFRRAADRRLRKQALRGK